MNKLCGFWWAMAGGISKAETPDFPGQVRQCQSLATSPGMMRAKSNAREKLENTGCNVRL
jgi:hypothetical protein